MTAIVKAKQSPLGLPGTVTESSLALPASSIRRLGSGGENTASDIPVASMVDWRRVAFGEHKYGERAAQAVEGESFQTLANAGYVSRAFSETSPRGEVVPSGAA